MQPAPACKECLQTLFATSRPCRDQHTILAGNDAAGNAGDDETAAVDGALAMNVSLVMRVQAWNEATSKEDDDHDENDEENGCWHGDDDEDRCRLRLVVVMTRSLAL